MSYFTGAALIVAIAAASAFSGARADSLEQAVHDRIASNVAYPKEALAKHRDGEVAYSMNIAPDGSLSSVSLVKSSGDRKLDAAAIEAVKKAAPFSPVGASLHLHGTVSYQIE